MDIQIRKFSEKRLIGLAINTDFSTASVDCPKIWQKFHGTLQAVLEPIPLPGIDCESYGLSIMHTKHCRQFDYVVAVPYNKTLAKLEEFREFTLRGGFYVVIESRDLSQLPSLFKTLYERWGPSQGQYQLDYSGLAFEWYAPDYAKSKRYAIYAPLTAARKAEYDFEPSLVLG